MTQFLAILFLFCLVLLVIGLIKPTWVIRWGKKRTRGRAVLTYAIAAFIIFLIIGFYPTKSSAPTSSAVSTPNTPNTTTTEPSASAPTTNTTQASQPTSTYPAGTIEFTGKVDPAQPSVSKQPEVKLIFTVTNKGNGDINDLVFQFSPGKLIKDGLVITGTQGGQQDGAYFHMGTLYTGETKTYTITAQPKAAGNYDEYIAALNGYKELKDTSGKEVGLEHNFIILP